MKNFNNSKISDAFCIIFERFFFRKTRNSFRRKKAFEYIVLPPPPPPQVGWNDYIVDKSLSTILSLKYLI